MKRKKTAVPLRPVHPGEVLRCDFLEPLGLTAYRVAKAVGVPRTRVERLAREETPVTADTALRLGRFFGTSARFWMNLQARHDLEIAEAAARQALEEITPHRAAA
jgi:antitoxin HigA-1